MYCQAKQWSQRPSSILGIENQFEAYCFDQATWYFGNHVEGEVAKAREQRGKQDNNKKQQARAEARFKELMGLGTRFRSAPTKKV